MQGLAYWLPKGAIVIEGKWDEDTADWVISVSPYIDADTSSSHWRLTQKGNHLFEDNVTLEVDAKTGLLKTVTGTSEDKTAAIVAEGLAIAAKAMTFGAGVPTASFKRARPTPIRCGEPVPLRGSFRYIIDSSDLPSDETQDLCRTLVVSSAPTPTPTSISATNVNPTPTPTPTPTATPIPKTYNIVIHREDKRDSRPTNNLRIGDVTDGIVVRAPAPYRVIITVNDKPNLRAEQLLFCRTSDVTTFCRSIVLLS
jgi:hypothetical protein